MGGKIYQAIKSKQYRLKIVDFKNRGIKLRLILGNTITSSGAEGIRTPDLLDGV